MEKKSISLKPIIKMLTFQHNFESISKKFGAADSIKVSSKKKSLIFQSISILLVNLTY